MARSQLNRDTEHRIYRAWLAGGEPLALSQRFGCTLGAVLLAIGREKMRAEGKVPPTGKLSIPERDQIISLLEAHGDRDYIQIEVARSRTVINEVDDWRCGRPRHGKGTPIWWTPRKCDTAAQPELELVRPKPQPKTPVRLPAFAQADVDVLNHFDRQLKDIKKLLERQCEQLGALLKVWQQEEGEGHDGQAQGE